MCSVEKGCELAESETQCGGKLEPVELVQESVRNGGFHGALLVLSAAGRDVAYGLMFVCETS